MIKNNAAFNARWRTGDRSLEASIIYPWLTHIAGNIKRKG
jgi:hypothetical protein